ncbi:hypothetical protein SPONN_2048 [uncultured Candidatus Thioglobus sp.]|nr:hypothetical protein SPONN_2048 [uncultured Candidatus Thioglobus sp.]
MSNNIDTFFWNKDKNKQLKIERGLCFEDFISQVDADNILDLIKHPNAEKYPNQSIYIVELMGYVCMVPCIREDGQIFLKTIIPSRKMQKMYGNEK